ncbi:MAG: PilZ domain-containing protein [Chrysiogenetes bacterium]|nr:PilZ domain-containing protein [Chrysiogenetes bacterium]
MGTRLSYIVNRRDDPRHEVENMAVKMRPADSDEDYLVEYAGNLSRSGIFLKSETPFDVETELDLVFRLPEEEAEQLGRSSLHVSGTVVWVNRPGEQHENAGPGMGVRFEDIDEDTLHVLERIIHRVAVLPDAE